MNKERLLEVKNLEIVLTTQLHHVYPVRDVSFSIDKGETVALVGESGCGKSVTAHTLMRLIPSPPVHTVKGEILFNQENLLTKSEKEMRAIRGKSIGMIFQDPLTSLDPTMKIGKQIIEGILKHEKLSYKEAYARALELLHLVGITEPKRRIEQYPYELSGGMRQRVVIAIAIACHPLLLIADEPTTALDVTIQAQILDLLKAIQKERNMSILLITHDLGIVADMCDRVMVMYAGKIVEEGSLDRLFYHPQHPYTQALLNAVPRIDREKGTPLPSIVGSPPDLTHPPAGCAFHPRCPFAMPICCKHTPALDEAAAGYRAACWLLEKRRRLG